MLNTFDTGIRPVLVEMNATVLGATLGGGAGDTTVQTHADSNGGLVEGDTVTIHAEDVLLGPTADSGLNFTGCTRGHNSTTRTTHQIGEVILKATGTTLISETFTATDYINCVWMNSFKEGKFRVTLTESDGTTISYWWAATTPYVFTVPCPIGRRRAPGAGATILIEAWTTWTQDAMTAAVTG